ncbi:MAG: pyridoxamine 5'-phosphate oxidase family protein [Nitriliruptorales bacterium]|nr:pyridoxamine 5'-phosphate oxidase family protein [Nitriliruptorales bacterium]
MQALLGAARHGLIALSVLKTTDGGFTVYPLLPLVDGERVVFALPYAEALTARDLARASGGVVLVFADGRLAGRAWSPVAAAGRVTLDEDPRGDRFQRSLLTQELYKHPPSRALIDSPMLRREHWWYVPRLLVTFEPERIWPVEPLDSERGVLAWMGEERVDAATTVVEGGAGGWEHDVVVLQARPAGCGGRVLLCRHDFSLPDREVSSTLVVQGMVDGRRVRAEERRGAAALPPAPGLLRRMRRQRALERGCRAGLAAAGSQGRGRVP